MLAAVKYFIAYDSKMGWFYGATEEFAKNFQEKEFIFSEQKIIFKPLKRFDEYNQTVILYEVEKE